MRDGLQQKVKLSMPAECVSHIGIEGAAVHTADRTSLDQDT